MQKLMQKGSRDAYDILTHFKVTKRGLRSGYSAQILIERNVDFIVAERGLANYYIARSLIPRSAHYEAGRPICHS